MAVGTQNLKVVAVFPPIFHPARPRPFAIVRANLSGRVNMVQFKNANIGYAALRASATKVGNQLTSCGPIAFLLSSRVHLGLAGLGTIARRCWFSAIHACAAVGPSFGRIAFSRAILCVSSARPAFLNVKLISADNAFLVRSGRLSVRGKASQALVPRCFCHKQIIGTSEAICKNFEIARKRVEEAYRQPDLFVEPPTPPTQDKMDL